MPLGTHKATLFGVAGVSTGDVVLLSSQTASDSASLDFTSGIDSTYGEYIFKFYNLNPATDDVNFTFQVNASDDEGGAYDESLITSTFFRAYHTEADATGLSYTDDRDLAQSASYQILAYGVGSGADESCAGELHLFNPSSTTYVKHFYARVEEHFSGEAAFDQFPAGYINQPLAITQIDFKMSSGNFDGTIKMWGVKN